MIAAQLTVTSGKPARAPAACTSRETISLPTPLSPVMRTFASVRAAALDILAEPLHGDTLTNQFEGFVHIR